VSADGTLHFYGCRGRVVPDGRHALGGVGARVHRHPARRAVPLWREGQRQGTRHQP
jgi:hypothetical protein